ncbi:hypothetical protein G6F46_014149 [Rhizopus delemar]|nr:hypothetical protein G6F46_014149 [Rhizopus delemar]
MLADGCGNATLRGTDRLDLDLDTMPGQVLGHFRARCGLCLGGVDHQQVHGLRAGEQGKRIGHRAACLLAGIPGDHDALADLLAAPVRRHQQHRHTGLA